MDFGPYTTKKDTLGGIKLTNDKQGILEDLLNGNVVNDYTANKIGKILFPDNPEGPFKIEMGFGTDSADETIANRKQKVLEPTFTGRFAFLEAYKFAKLYERSFNKANKYDYKNNASSNPIDKFCVPLRIFVPNDTDLATESIKENKMTKNLQQIRQQMKRLAEDNNMAGYTPITLQEALDIWKNGGTVYYTYFDPSIDRMEDCPADVDPQLTFGDIAKYLLGGQFYKKA